MVDSTGTTTYGYSNQGQLTSVVDGNGKTVTYAYNYVGQRTCVSYPNPSSGTWYDCSATGASGATPPSGDVSYSYVYLGRLSTVSDWNGDAFTYAYACDGSVDWMTESSNTAIPTVDTVRRMGGTPRSPF